MWPEALWGSAKDELGQKFRKEKPASLEIQDDRTKVVRAPSDFRGPGKETRILLGVKRSGALRKVNVHGADGQENGAHGETNTGPQPQLSRCLLLSTASLRSRKVSRPFILP